MFSLFKDREVPALIGMVHLKALPGSPRWKEPLEKIIEAAVSDAEKLLEGGCDALIIENMNDLPYLKGYVYPETIASMSIVAQELMKFGAYTGLQVLAAANEEALAIATVVGAHFIRVEGFAYAHVADEGWIDASAGKLLRKRRELNSEVAIWADVQKKHASHSVTRDLSILELAKGAKFCGADALIVTGNSTGEETSLDDIKAVKRAQLPTIVGSGVNDTNIQALAQYADGLIVGSWLKIDGDWQKPVSLERVKKLRSLLDNMESI